MSRREEEKGEKRYKEKGRRNRERGRRNREKGGKRTGRENE